MNIDPPEYIKKIKPYKAGKPIEELEREYGIKNAVKLASNENPLGPSPKAVEAVKNFCTSLHRYPDSSGYELINKISSKFNISSKNIVLGNGSDDIIALLCKAFVNDTKNVIMPDPGFLMYEISTRSEGGIPVKVPLKNLCLDLDKMAELCNPDTSIIFITNPNNPTGSFIEKEKLEEFLKKIPSNVIVASDEAYMEFSESYYCSWELMEKYENLVSMRTFSKAYGLAGLRIGYGVMNPFISEILNRIRQPFNTSLISQKAALCALDDEDFLEKTRTLIFTERKKLFEELEKLGITPFKSDANFILADLKRSADDVYEKLLRKGVIARSMSSYGYPEFLRITIGLENENNLFINCLKEVLDKY
ncbi:MAG: histidinol-phosphate transaminase [Desulfobacteraceae bacterium]|nr:histidinol-phosphate transaminase [Desulfobacteraceae bacterium]MCB9494292.1 histidinol-phosphate transaminase [Desulfobacteraceae bacterium]